MLNSGIYPPKFGGGAVAQLGERLLCKQEVVGSIPISSTSQWLVVRLGHAPDLRTGLCFEIRFFDIVKRK